MTKLSFLIILEMLTIASMVFTIDQYRSFSNKTQSSIDDRVQLVNYVRYWFYTIVGQLVYLSYLSLLRSYKQLFGGYERAPVSVRYAQSMVIFKFMKVFTLICMPLIDGQSFGPVSALASTIGWIALELFFINAVKRREAQLLEVTALAKAL